MQSLGKISINKNNNNNNKSNLISIFINAFFINFKPKIIQCVLCYKDLFIKCNHSDLLVTFVGEKFLPLVCQNLTQFLDSTRLEEDFSDQQSKATKN